MRRSLACSALCALLLAPAAALAQGEVFAHDLRFAAQANLFSFPANDPMTQTQIGPVGGLNYTTFAMDFNTAGTALYAIDHSIAITSLRFGTINLTTGMYEPGPTITGPMSGNNPTGLSVDPTTETFYASTANALFTLDPITGVTTPVGSFLGPTGAPIGTVIDIAVDNFGNMFAHVLGTAPAGGALWSINKATGAATLVGTSGIATSFAQGMDFDPTTNLLYAALYTSGGVGSYGIWNTTNGSWTEILPLIAFPDPTPNGRELEMAIRVPGPAGLAVLALGAPVLLKRRRR